MQNHQSPAVQDPPSAAVETPRLFDDSVPSSHGTSRDVSAANLAAKPIRNSNFLSNHWLEHRLPLEPEWGELRDQAVRVA